MSAMSAPRALRVMIASDLRSQLDNRWLVAIAALYAALSWLVCNNAFAFAGTGAPDPAAVLVSLVSLQLYVVPLLALMLGYDVVLSEIERGTFHLHLAYGVRVPLFLAGRFGGRAATLALAILPGLVIQGAHMPGGLASAAFAAHAGMSLLLGIAALSVGILLSTLVTQRSTALSLALVFWLGGLVVFDLAVIGLLVGTSGAVPSWAVTAVWHVNPFAVFREGAYAAVLTHDQARALVGESAIGAITACLLLVPWAVGPLAAAWAWLSRRYEARRATAAPAPAVDGGGAR